MISLLFAGSKDKGQGQKFAVAVIFIEVFVRFKSVDLRINVNFIVDDSYYIHLHLILNNHLYMEHYGSSLASFQHAI